MILNKRHFLLVEYEFNNGDLTVFLDLGDNKYTEDNIDENSFKNFIIKSGKLDYIEDCWDGYTESHYTKNHIIDYTEWKKDICEKGDILDFLDYFYKSNKIPDYLVE